MIDITVQMIKEMVGKNMTVRENCINGVLTGLAVQRELVMAGKVYYDGFLVAALKISAEKEISALIKEMGDEYERKLPENLFIGWSDKKGNEREYFTYFGVGMIYVCKLYQELATVGLEHPGLLVKLYDIVDKRMAELKVLR